MIRSSKVTLKYSNQIKKDNIKLFLNEYLILTQFFIDTIWTETKIPNLLPKDITSKANTWLSARMVQCSAKQASGIVRGTKKKNEQRQYRLNKLLEEKRYKQARKLQAIINKNPINKPELKNIEAELDSRFVSVNFEENKISFDGWLNISSIGNKIKLKIPFKSHKKLNELREEGTRTGSIRLGLNSASMSFELREKENNNTKVIGIDIGIKTAFTCSDNNNNNLTCNGHTYESVCKILSRKKKGSKAFSRTQTHRKNILGYYKNQIDWNNIKEIRIENIRNLRYGKSTSRYMSHFNYSELFGMLESEAERQNVFVVKLSPTYTSQRCSQCGWTRKSNRKKKMFKCGSCGYVSDSDFNASINISLCLPVISKAERNKRKNLSGFYYLN